jgi:tetratricopeptide (TPR) repeat protein
MRLNLIFQRLTCFALLLLGSSHFSQATAQTSPSLSRSTQRALLRQCPFRFAASQTSPAAIQSLQQQIAAAQAAGNLGQVAGLLNQLGNIYLVLGQYDQSTQAYQRSIDLARSTKSLSIEAASLGGLAHTNVELGQYSQATTQFNRSFQIRQSLNINSLAALSLSNLGIVSNLQGKFSVADNYYQQGLALVRTNDPTQTSFASPLLQGNQGNTEFFTQNAVVATATYDRLFALRTLDASNEGALLNNRGLAYQAVGKFDLALQSYDLALQKLEAPNHRSCQWKTLSNRGRLLTGQGQLAAAIVAYRQATDITSKIWRDSILKLSPEQRTSYRQMIRPIYLELAVLLTGQGKFAEAELLLATLKSST